IVPLDKPNTTDFVSFYAAGALADAGTPALAYDQAAHLAAEEAVVGRGIEYQFFNYPPVYQALFMPISRLPYLAAFIGFETATLLLYLAVARRILGDYGGTALLALIAFPMVWWNIGLGQNAFLTAALFGAATLLVDRRPGLAGICFGALCYKPHFAVLVPLALAAGGHWRVIAAAAATAAVLIALSVAVLGWATWQAFFITAGTSHSMYESGRILFAGFVSPFGAVRLLGGGIALGYAVQAVFAIVAAAIVAIVWWRGASLPARAAVLASASLIASPVSLLYDLMLGTIAACWLLRDGGRAPGWEKAVVAVMYVFLLGSRYFAETISLPVNTIVATSLLAMATRRAWREFGFTAPWRQQPDATPSR
ncbi:MAG TPA: glycosyltransferase family 87 protein, partial [Stellaceae bacterium]|nr:glycosyltransferase family 87 protein [Stellaceae bacterium]